MIRLGEHDCQACYLSGDERYQNAGRLNGVDAYAKASKGETNLGAY